VPSIFIIIYAVYVFDFIHFITRIYKSSTDVASSDDRFLPTDEVARLVSGATVVAGRISLVRDSTDPENINVSTCARNP